VTEPDSIGDRLLVVFDGLCGLCDRSVRWFLARDRNDRLRFAPSDAPAAAALLTRHGFDAAGVATGPSTIVVAQEAGGTAERLLTRSDAVLAILSQLPFPWPAVSAVLHWIPRPMRDLAYRLVARFRYRVWGRVKSCPVPTAHGVRRG